MVSLMRIDAPFQVVIGSGAAGLLSVIVANGLGKTCALVEQHAMGGDCLNVGCVPSKVSKRRSITEFIRDTLVLRAIRRDQPLLPSCIVHMLFEESPRVLCL